jgi:hypothetical protein
MTTSGMFSTEPLACAVAALGHAGHFMDHAALSDIAFNNAKRILKL